MPNTLISTGALANLLARGIVTVNPAASATRPLAALFDGDPGLPMGFGSLTALPHIDVDLDMFQSLGDFEGTFVGNDPPGFTGVVSGTGTVTKDTTNKTKGTASCALNAGTAAGNDASVKRQIEVRAGERIRVRARLRSSAGGLGQVISVYIRNPRTGMRWDGAGWTNIGVPFAFSWQSATFSTQAQTQTSFAMESFDACAGPTTILEVEAKCSGSSTGAYTGNVDELEVLVGPTLLAVIGHNADRAIAFVVYGADEPTFASPTPLSDPLIPPVPRQPSFYTKWAENFFRHVRIYGGNNSAALAFGEMFLCSPLTLLRSPDWPLRVGFREPQVRNRNAAGGSFVAAQGREIRTITLPFSYRSDAQYDQARDEIIRRSRHGFHPTLIVPLDTEPDVYLARLDGSDWTPSRTHDRRDAPITLEEMPIADIGG